ncbi:MAG: hypothetical protein CME88_00680 [Hirschia sp.]|nr:hypothetical protein [Hirschia sp.]MBF16875.1 hypothetical protein [Hirschia sp.]|tara:strand:- start:3540 stop:3773 length:234 start_codon:yes stop_codon:yes gene_type:complete
MDEGWPSVFERPETFPDIGIRTQGIFETTQSAKTEMPPERVLLPFMQNTQGASLWIGDGQVPAPSDCTNPGSLRDLF